MSPKRPVVHSLQLKHRRMICRPPLSAPRVEEAAPVAASTEEELDGYVAPRAPGAGTPSPEALARLNAAVSKVPARNEAPTAAPTQPIAESGEKPRFGINSLINRMTGHAEARVTPPQQPVRCVNNPQSVRQQAQPAPVESADAEEEQIEIPAFLRRQAN